jgi:hypothetical protein
VNELGDVRQALGRIEGAQGQILASMTDLASAFAAHKAEDQKNFDALRQDSDRAKGASWVILGVLGVAVTLLGAVFLPLLSKVSKLFA